MVSPRNISSLLLLAGSAAAAPRWWAYQGPGDLAKQAQSSTAPAVTATAALSSGVAAQRNVDAESAYTPPPGGYVSDGVLYLTTTIYLQPGQLPPSEATSAPAASSPVQASPTAQEPSQQPPASSMATAQPAIPATTSSQSPVAQAPSAVPVASTFSKSATSPPPSAVNSPSATAAQPAASPSTNSGDGSITPEMISAIAPSLGSCVANHASTQDQCATAGRAAPALNSAFAQYKITNKAAQAAVIAWEAFESVEFAFTQNQQGNVGQGTRCMMMPNYVSQYATAVAGSAKVSAAGSPAAILALANADDATSFGAGAWYMATMCTADVMSAFASNPDSAWTLFMSKCVGTTDTSARDAYWTAAKAALGVST